MFRPHCEMLESEARDPHSASKLCILQAWAAGLDLIRIGAFRKQGHQNDFDIEQERPIIYVIQIALDAPPHLLDRISFSAAAVHLGPAANARLDPMAA